MYLTEIDNLMQGQNSDIDKGPYFSICDIAMLQFAKCNTILGIFITQNTSYWFAIFLDLPRDILSYLSAFSLSFAIYIWINGL